MIDILNDLPWFFAGMCLCAGLVMLIDAKRFVPAMADRVRIRRHVSLVELLDAMAKVLLVEDASKLKLKAIDYDDDVGSNLDPEVVKYFKKVLTDGPGGN